VEHVRKVGAELVTIELYGVTRIRAGTARVTLEAATLTEALTGLKQACPALDGSVVSGGAVLPAYKISLNGERFVTDPATPLVSGDVLLLLSADVGG
jgi:hypothetical protein